MSKLATPTTVNVYSVGICYASACAPADMEQAEVERQVNAQHPSGVSPWRVADEPFSGGEENPHLVEGCGRHWLLVC